MMLETAKKAEPDVIGDVPPSPLIRKAYNIWSFCYDQVASPWEHGPRIRGLEAVHLHPGDCVLDAAVGTAAVALEIARSRISGVEVWGIDLSSGMLAKARKKVNRSGFRNIHLLSADACLLPFPDGRFDVVYSAYTLDLLTLDDVSAALKEFWRVLHSGGRLVLVNMSRERSGPLGWFERFYRILPLSWAAFLLGGCRPVFLEGLVRQAQFCAVERTFVHHIISSEIVVARKP